MQEVERFIIGGAVSLLSLHTSMALKGKTLPLYDSGCQLVAAITAQKMKKQT
jgi:hypothetical protein